MKRPADTASSRAKDLVGKGSFYNNPVRPHSARTLMSSGSQKIIRRKIKERRQLTTTSNPNPDDQTATSELALPLSTGSPLTQRFYAETNRKESSNSEVKPFSFLPKTQQLD